MTLAAVIVLLFLVVLSGCALVLGPGQPLRAIFAVTLCLVLGAAALLSWWGDPPSDGMWVAGLLLAVAAAALGGGPVATAVLDAADPHRSPGTASDPEVLRGGAWIGALERIGVTGTRLAGWPEGLAVVLAVKGLGRYAELKAPAAAERFILGTLASVLWAAGCAGTAVLMRG